MRGRLFLRASGWALAGAAVISCADPTSTTMRLQPSVDLGLFPSGGTFRTAEAELVEVCKVYVMHSGDTPPDAEFTVIGPDDSGIFKLNDGECREVWVKNAGSTSDDVLVREDTPIDGFITTYTVEDQAGTTTGPTPGKSVTVTTSGTTGFLITFTNEEESRETGCTLTQGYWKTHASGKKFDDGWNLVGGPGALFFSSNMSWLQIFNTPPKGGNAYLQLAHQYMAAKLNALNGASTTPEVDAALTWAEGFFAGKTPSTSLTKSEIQDARTRAGTLASYNEGAIGPGHCQAD